MKRWLFIAILMLVPLSAGAQITSNTGGSNSISLPVSAGNGGNGDSLGRLLKTPPNVTLGIVPTNCNGVTGDVGCTIVTNKLVAYDWAGWPAASPTYALLASSTIPAWTVPVGVCTSGCSSGGTPTIVHQGNASCVFDGTPVVGNIATVSTTVDGDCHDSGTAQGGQIATPTLGTIVNSNGGAGVASTVAFNLAPQVPHAFSTKVIVGANTNCGIDTWTTVKTQTFAGLPIDPGFQNAEFHNVGGNVDILFGATMPSLLAFRLAVTSNGVGAQTQTDPHGFNPTGLATFAPNTEYSGLVWPAPYVVFFQGSVTSLNPLRVGGSILLQCQQHGGTAVSVRTSTLDSYNGTNIADGGTQMQVEAVAMMGTGN